MFPRRGSYDLEMNSGSSEAGKAQVPIVSEHVVQAAGCLGAIHEIAHAGYE